MRREVLPRQRVTAGAVIRDAVGRVLLVEPTYRSDWLTHGGSVEADESPAAGAAREVREELGVALPVGRLLVVQWEQAPGGVLHLAYDGGVVDATVIARFGLEPGLASFRFVEPAALHRLASATTAERVDAALDALERGTVVELPVRRTTRL